MAVTISILKRLRKNALAYAAAITIVLVALIALFAYPLSPDHTPDANDMIVELSAKPAGFSKQFLRIPKQQTPPHYNIFKQLFSGKPSAFTLLPFNSYDIVNDTLIVKHYIDDGMEDTVYFSAKDLKMSNLSKDAIDESRITTKRFYLGTDRYGRDILSRLLVGARVSMAVGIISVVLSLSIGILLGAIAGWYGGWVDNVVMWIINILWSIPTLLLVFAITLTIGKGFWEIFIAIGLTSWVSAARLIRGQVMQVKEMDYITAARALGFRNSRIIIKHILPNIAGPIMVVGAANFATAILVEAGLSFLGIGVQPPTPSWGLMIKEHYNFLIAGNPIPAIIPGLAIIILVLAFNILGNALRDAIDVRMN